jgi:hypothetical protein
MKSIKIIYKNSVLNLIYDVLTVTLPINYDLNEGTIQCNICMRQYILLPLHVLVHMDHIEKAYIKSKNFK